MPDSKLPALTEISTFAIDDYLYTVDKSDTTDDATGSSRRCGIDRLAGFFNPAICDGRLTLETGVPVSTTDQTAKTSVYFTPYNGNRIAVYDGTRWELYTFTELTLALGTLTSDKNYDVFVYDNAGTLTLELSAAWTNDTTRATALTTQDGIHVKSGATTRRYLGTIRTTSTTTTEDSGGGSANQVGGKRFVWNCYNRIHRTMAVKDTTDSWTYTTSSFRQSNNAAGNKVEFVVGLAEDHLSAMSMSACANSGGGFAHASGIGVDSTTVSSSNLSHGSNPASGSGGAAYSHYRGVPGLGYHYLAWLELSGTATGTTTWWGDANLTYWQTGLVAEMQG